MLKWEINGYKTTKMEKGVKLTRRPKGTMGTKGPKVTYRYSYNRFYCYPKLTTLKYLHNVWNSVNFFLTVQYMKFFFNYSHERITLTDIQSYLRRKCVFVTTIIHSKYSIISFLSLVPCPFFLSFFPTRRFQICRFLFMEDCACALGRLPRQALHVQISSCLQTVSTHQNLSGNWILLRFWWYFLI